MANLKKYQLNEIVEYLSLKEYFQLRCISKGFKDLIDSLQRIVLKNASFMTFCPYLFNEENPFKNSKLSIQKIRELFFRQSEGDEETKEYKNMLKNFILTVRSLKFQVGSQQPLVCISEQNSQILDKIRFNQFIEDIVLFNIRNSPVPLPQNIDEVMQEFLGTYFQEYLYSQYGHQAKREENLSSSQMSSFSRLSFMYVINYFNLNKEIIIKQLQRNDKEELLRRFYLIRWYHCEPLRLNQYQICDIRPEDFSQQPADIFVNLIQGIYNAFVEQCSFYSYILSNDIKNSDSPLAILEYYSTMWNAFISSVICLDEQLQEINKLVNSIFQIIDKQNDNIDYPFSILKLGCVIWKKKMYKQNKKSLIKAIKANYRQFLKLKKNELMMRKAGILQTKNRRSSDGDSSDIGQSEVVQNEFQTQQQQSDLIQFQEEQKRKELLKTSLIRVSKAIQDISLSQTSVHFLGSTDLKLKNTPYANFAKIILEDTIDFHKANLMPNENLYQNSKDLIIEINSLLLPCSQRELMKFITENTINLVKDKIKELYRKYQKEKRQYGFENETGSEGTQQSDIFKHSLGLYMKEKNVSIPTQKYLALQLSKEEQNLYNYSMHDYSKQKRQIEAVNQRISQHIKVLQIKQDEEDQPMSLECFSLETILEDFKKLIKQNYRSSRKSVVPQESSNLISNVRRTRLSLVPFYQHRVSLISNSTTESALRQSVLASDISSVNRDSSILKNCKVDYISMLDFFSGGNNNSNSQTRSDNNKKSDDDQIFSKAQELIQPQKKVIIIDEQNDDIIESNVKQSSGSNERAKRSNSVPQQQEEEQKMIQISLVSKKYDEETDCSSNFEKMTFSSTRQLLGQSPLKQIRQESKDIFEQSLELQLENKLIQQQPLTSEKSLIFPISEQEEESERRKQSNDTD